MSPASYRTAPPRVARTTLPGGEPQAKSKRRDVRYAGPAPAPVGLGCRDAAVVLLCPSCYRPADGDGVAEGELEAAGAGLASGAVTGILASASIAFFSAAATFFCASP